MGGQMQQGNMGMGMQQGRPMMQQQGGMQQGGMQQGGGMMGGETNHIPLKLNTAGVIPPIFASSLLLLPLTIVGFSGAEGGDFTASIAQYLQHGQPIYMILYGGFIAFFCFFYTFYHGNMHKIIFTFALVVISQQKLVISLQSTKEII